MGFSHDGTLAQEVRKIRDHYLRSEPLRGRFIHNTEILLRTWSHLSLIYGTMRRLKEAHSKSAGDDEETVIGFHPNPKQDLANEYTRPLTALDRFLGMHNLQLLTEYHEQRIRLSHRYASHFAGNPLIKQPQLPITSISHYVIRVNASQREAIRRLLWRAGIDTGVVFPFPTYLSPEEYPRSKELGAEILNLPLDHRLNPKDVDYIAVKVKESVQICEKMQTAG
jgi:DegT/DnrJ/EryC1/StrS aminotransferase family